MKAYFKLWHVKTDGNISDDHQFILAVSDAAHAKERAINNTKAAFPNAQFETWQDPPDRIPADDLFNPIGKPALRTKIHWTTPDMAENGIKYAVITMYTEDV